MSRIGFIALTFLPIVAALTACIRIEPGLHPNGKGAFIDSVGFRAAQVRMEKITVEDSDNLISEALRSPGNLQEGGTQPDFFQSIEDSYQRYRRIFFLYTKGPSPEVRCDYDLLETFRLNVFDPQPFMNAILHTFPLREVTTLDFTSQPHAQDTLLVRVSWARAASPGNTGSFAVIEGSLELYVAKHSVSLASPLPRELSPLDGKMER